MAIMAPLSNGATRYSGALQTSQPWLTAPTTPTAIISRPVASLPISTVPVRIPTALPQPALPPVTPPPSVSVVSAAGPSLPVLQRIGPILSPGAANSVAQPSITPNQVASQYGAYQEPQQYTATLPVVSIPSATDVGTPTLSGTTGGTVEFGLTENTWLLILIAAAVILFLTSK